MDHKEKNRFEPTIELEGLNYHFGEQENRIQVLFSVALTVYPGEVALITGPSGSGKTTLLSLIGGLRSVQEGRLQVMGKNLSNMDGKQLQKIRKNIGFIFQTHNLFESLTARQTLLLGMQLHDYSKKEREKRPVDILTELGLAERLDHKPDELSEGQRQRVAIGRALINNPQMILADEPTAALDKDAGRRVVQLLRNRALEHNCTILIVTHDNRILDVADRVIKLVDGYIVSDVLVKESLAVGKKNALQVEIEPIIQSLADERPPILFAPGETVIKDGNINGKFYYIQSGRAEVIRYLNGWQSITEKLGPGDIIGELVLLKSTPRKATVRAVDALALVELSPSTFHQLVQGTIDVNERAHQVLFY